MNKLQRNILLFTVWFFASVICNSQIINSYTINWKKDVLEQNFNENVKLKSLAFDDAQYTFNEKLMPFFITGIQNVPNSDKFKVTLQNTRFADLENEYTELINPALLSSDIIVNQSVSFERFKPILSVQFFPFILGSNGQIKKLLSFDLVIENIGIPVNFSVLKSNRSFANSSVLAAGSGDWYKIAILRNGIYKLSYQQLKNLGIDIDNISPNALNIYGNAFGQLPDENFKYRPDDLIKNAIYIEGDGDGVFNQNDYILFYAKGPDVWQPDVTLTEFIHKKNIYSDTAYYFLNVNTANPQPKRITQINSTPAAATTNVSSFNDYNFIEPDLYNFIKSGREWYGDLYDFITKQTYTFGFPNIEASSPVRIRAEFAARTPGSSNSNFNIKHLQSGINSTVTIPGVGNGAYAPAAIAGGTNFQFTTGNPEINLEVNFNKGNSSAQGWLNYIRVNARRQLIFNTGVNEFRDLNSVGTGNVSEFIITSANPNFEIWEITSATDVQKINAIFSGTTYNFRLHTDSLREFVIFNHTFAANPVRIEKIQNQDLHALPYADLIIVSHPLFLSEANRLAQLHINEGMSVHVVDVNHVYNEFSSGMKDACAIRHFLRMFYARAGGDPNLLPKHLLLMGDGSYDNKYRLAGNTSFIPTYQSLNSTEVTVSYTSDDYFVLLDDNESMNDGDRLDMGVGRIICKNVAEAKNVVDKIIRYSTGTGNLQTQYQCCNQDDEYALGDWRNWYSFVADDQDWNAYISACERFADSLKVWHPFINIDKIYLDAYKQISTPGGQRYPDVEEAIKQRVENGALVINYIGHGGEIGWAHERILNVATINNWSNGAKLPLFMTATCEFSRFDDPSRTSAGELVLLNPKGGGIALFTTTRLVYSGPNEQLNERFNRFVLQKPNNESYTFGEIFMRSKNLALSANTRNFTLLGDPAVKIKIPDFNVITDSLNGVHISSNIDTLKALSLITVKGHINDHNGQKLSSFNGIIYPTVFDKEINIITLANDANISPPSFPFNFDLQKNIIFRGKASVTNGEFSFSFLVPKDINYQFGPGKISYYAHDGSIDAGGYNKNIIVGGVNPNAPQDNQGPEIKLFLNDEKFVFGSITDENPKIFARLFDENGINTVGTGIGHDINAVLDNNTANPIKLNEFYEADVNTYKSGQVVYPLNKLSEGTHNLRIKAWDVYNNSGDAYTEFVVAPAAEIALHHVLNYPNPFTTRTQFWLEHNQNCSQLQVLIQVMTITGKVVKSIQQTVRTEGNRIEPIEWDGRDDFGDKLARGTYIYRVKIQTPDQKHAEKIEKLVILN